MTLAEPPIDAGGLDRLTTPALAEIARCEGIDAATQRLYHAVRESPLHAPFIHAVEQLNGEPAADYRGKVLIAPAAFYREYPRFGGDGRMIRRIAEAYGLETALLPTPSKGGVVESARIIRDALEAEPHDGVVLVSLSKGGADVRLALAESEVAAHKVDVWLQIGGMIHGTPLVDDLLGRGWPARGILRGFLALTRASTALVHELSARPGALLSPRAVAPAGITVLNVVGFPLREHLRGRLRTRHAKLARLGPNDGCTLLREAVVEPGFIYPLWGGDHYFRSPDAPILIARLFRYLGETGLLQSRPAGDRA